MPRCLIAIHRFEHAENENLPPQNAKKLNNEKTNSKLRDKIV